MTVSVLMPLTSFGGSPLFVWFWSTSAQISNLSLKHAPDVGLTFGISCRRRARRGGTPAAVGHFVRRYLAFLGMGAIISAGATALGFNQWC
jgi:hypothetical protein